MGQQASSSWRDGLARAPDARLELLAGAKDVGDAAQLTARAFAGSETAEPEGVLDWALGPELRTGPLYSCPGPNPPALRHECMEYISTVNTLQSVRRGMILGVKNDQGKLVGAALLLTPITSHWLIDSMAESLARLEARLAVGFSPPWTLRGENQKAREARFAAIKQVIGPLHAELAPGPHYYINMISVDPTAQGQGIGKAMLDAIGLMADRDNVPVYLEAGGDARPRLYEKFGFKTVKLLPTIPVAEDSGAEPFQLESGLHLMLRPAAQGASS